ncbi:MAG: hypothetical protein Tsb008_07340 [Rhodothalassiaceae bacterium]
MVRTAFVSRALILGFGLAFGNIAASKASDFSGFSIGLGVGVHDFNITAKNADLRLKLGDTDTEGVFFAAYDFDITEKMLAGIEFNGAIADANIDNELVGSGFIFDGSNWGVSARLGTLLTDRLMAYGLLGYQRINIGDNNGFDGIRFGGGLEAKLFWNISARAGYSRIETSSAKSGLDGTTRLSAGDNVVRFLVGFRF